MLLKNYMQIRTSFIYLGRGWLLNFYNKVISWYIQNVIELAKDEKLPNLFYKIRISKIAKYNKQNG